MNNKLNNLYIARVTDELYEEIEKIRKEIGLSKSGITRYLLFSGMQNVKNNLCV